MYFSELILWANFFILGTILGSFSGALIHRLHHDKPGLWTGRSKCPQCGHTLAWWNLIPLVSYLIQGGTCAYCKKKIPFTYFLFELVFGSVFLIFAQKFSSIELLIPMLITAWFLLVLFFYDLLYMEVDLRLIIPAIALAALWIIWREGDWQLYVTGGLVGALFYGLQYALSRGKWVGAGDIYFGALLGLLLGWPVVLICLFMAYIVGIIVSAYLMIFKGYTRKSAVPMGAFLMPAGLVCLYNGSWFLQQYLTWFGLDQFYSF